MAEVQGIQKLRRKLQDLSPEYQREIFKAFEQGADQATGMMRGLVPRKTGALYRSIGWTWGEAPEGSISTADHTAPKTVGPDGVERLTIYAGNKEAFYARWVEFGTVKLHAQPFFFPSWRVSRKAIQSRNKRAMSKVARKVARGGN